MIIRIISVISIVPIIAVHQPQRVRGVYRVVMAVSVQVHTCDIAHWIGLHEPTDLWIIVSGTVVVQAAFLVEVPACEHEQVHVVGVGGADLAVDRVFVNLYRTAAGIAQGYNAAQASKW